MKKWVVILVSIILLILDNSLIPGMAIKGAFPNLLFIFAISYSLVKGIKEAVIIGVFTGIIQDIFFYSIMGINSFSNLLLCVLAAFIGENIFKNKKLIPVLTMFILSIIKVCLVYIFMKFAGKDININRALLSALYNTFIMYFVYNFILRLCDEEYRVNPWRFR